MDKGIKPTRLWHWTGWKDFWGRLKCRYTALDHPHTPLNRKDLGTILATTLAAATGLLYSLGRFTPDWKPPERECPVDAKEADDPCRKSAAKSDAKAAPKKK